MSKEIRISESEVASLLEEVRMELAAFTLSKAEDDSDKKDKDEDKAKDGPAPSKDDGPAAELAPGEDAPKEDVAPAAPPAAAADPVDDSAMAAPDAMSPEASAEEVSPEADMGAAIEPAPTVAELQAEYEKLSDEELAMHVMAAKAAANSRNAAAAPAMPPPANPVPPEMAAPAPDMALKAEVKKAEDKIAELEAKLADFKAKSDKHEKDLDDLVNFVAKPIRKSAKFISEVAPVDPPKEPLTLSKTQVIEKLNEVSRNPSLKKSDRELISKYCVGQVKVDALEHLLK